MTEPVQWIALALAMVNKPFACRLYREVGPNAFYDGAAGLIYDQIEIDAGQAAIRDILGLKVDGKLSDAVIAFLQREAKRHWSTRTRQDGFGEARRLQHLIDEATKKLTAMARQRVNEEVPVPEEGKP